jgi:Na+-transporting NADH:ubiquinone oxidoreductase subunit B
MSGDQVWTAVNTTKQTVVDSFTGATPLSIAAQSDAGQGVVRAIESAGYSWSQAFLGLVPGSIGEVSALGCVLGAIILIVTGVGSWRIMVSMVLGGIAGSYLMSAVASPTSAGIMTLPWTWQLVVGGFAFGCVYMATDPVSAAATSTGMWIYGFLIGVLSILIRAVNPAYPEGVMLAILFMNVFAPLIDHFVVQSNVRRRLARV